MSNKDEQMTVGKMKNPNGGSFLGFKVDRDTGQVKSDKRHLTMEDDYFLVNKNRRYFDSEIPDMEDDYFLVNKNRRYFDSEIPDIAAHKITGGKLSKEVLPESTTKKIYIQGEGNHIYV